MIYQQKVDFQAHYLPKVYYDFLEEEGGFTAPTASPHRSGMRRGSRRR